MKKKGQGMSFLLRISIGMIIIWILALWLLGRFMSVATERSIMKVSNTYMSEVSEQIKEKFTSVLTIRFVQLDGVQRRTPPDSEGSTEEMLEELRVSADVREFSSFGFMSADGEVETIYGERISVFSKDKALRYLSNSGKIVTRGYDASGQDILVLGTEAGYEMSNGETSVALIAAVPMEYLREALFLYADENGIYFHIIDNEGSFVIKSEDIEEKNYFNYMLSGLEKYNKKTPDEYVEELKGQINRHEDFSAYIKYFGEEKHLYCSPIYTNYDWYIVAIMPDGIISKSIVELDRLRTTAIFFTILVITLSMLGVFIMYYKMMMTKIKELSEARNEALLANRAKSEFLSSMSHDIRTPMNAIVGMTEIALKNVDDPVRMNEYLKKIKISSKHLMGLINDVLDMSKIESGKMQLNENSLSLRAIMEDTVNIMQPQVKAKNQQFDIFIGNIISEDVICDSIRLNQVILNLVSNAVKYTPDNGTIGIYVYQEQSQKGEDYVQTHFKVSDNGIGMSEDFQKRVYDTFAREENDYVQQVTGTGLGLSITKAIIELMGGIIELDSELNKGSEFHVILDFRKSAVNSDNMRLPAWNVLVIDDNEQLCSSAASNLEELGVNAEWTMDGMKGIEMIEEHNRKNDDYNFVLIDWKMPNMDGIETIQKIRERMDKRIPVFLVSAYDWSDVKEEVDSLLVEGFISKPLFKSTLYERLSQYADENGNGQEQAEEQQVDFAGKRILLAEDIDINWEVAYEMLSITGLELERAVNGKDCVEKLENSETGYYDAILMDIRMPVMDGYDATRAIRALERQDKDLPIIAMTADAFQDDVQYCIDCGMNGHLAKPIDLQKCIDMLKQFLK